MCRHSAAPRRRRRRRRLFVGRPQRPGHLISFFFCSFFRFFFLFFHPTPAKTKLHQLATRRKQVEVILFSFFLFFSFLLPDGISRLLFFFGVLWPRPLPRFRPRPLQLVLASRRSRNSSNCRVNRRLFRWISRIELFEAINTKLICFVFFLSCFLLWQVSERGLVQSADRVDGAGGGGGGARRPLIGWTPEEVDARRQSADRQLRRNISTFWGSRPQSGS